VKENYGLKKEEAILMEHLKMEDYSKIEKLMVREVYDNIKNPNHQNRIKSAE